MHFTSHIVKVKPRMLHNRFYGIEIFTSHIVKVKRKLVAKPSFALPALHPT